MRPGRVAAIALALLLCAAGLSDFWRTARTTAAIDFYQMWVGARMARETRDFYDPATGARMGESYRAEAVAARSSRRHIAAATYRRNLEIFSSPFLYTIYAALPGSYEQALATFHAIALAALAVAIAVFARLLRWSTAAATGFFGVLLFAFEPIRSDLVVGNSNTIILGIIAVAAWLTSRGRFAGAGAMLAIATIAKPHVAMIFPMTYLFWITTKRWRDLARHAAGAMAAAVVAFVIGSIYFRSVSIWLEWVAAVRALPPNIVPLDIGNFSLAVIARSLSGVNFAVVIFLALAAMAAFIAFRRKPRADVAFIAIGAVLFHTISPLVWLHYFTLAVPLAMILMRPASGEPAVRRQIAGAASLLLMSVRPWDAFVPAAIQVAAFVNFGLLLLLAFGLRELSLLRKNRVQADEQGH